ncbi:MAG: UDP-N-acetylmuramoyl-L-alanine--D-glutamate ligase [Bacilli bacterium]|nr:UDP-N-acetylmuramoyl-L-alanine--D-glutamate ligase [Bacilli bacterium]
MFENKKLLILGFARSGYEAAKYLLKHNNTVILTDMKTEHDEKQIEELKELGIKFVLGSHPDDLLDSSFDYLIKNPGVPIDHKYVLKAKELGIEVINEVEMAFRLLPNDIKFVAITGTNGKTTTTTLIYNILKEAGKSAHLTGNIGYPLIGFLDKLKKDDIIVMETSCQQLENLTQFNPDIAVMTNLSPAHIDFLKSYENYKRVKTKIFQNHTEKNIAILNFENEDVLESTKNIKSTVKYFSSKKEINGCFIKDESIYYYDEKIIDLKDVKLIGIHNYENIMAAIMVVKELGVSNDYINKVLKEFKGVEHRIEFVRELNGVKYYNDSKATNIKATQIALSSFKTPVIILLGGLDRGHDFFELKDYMKYVKHIVALGECRSRVEQFAKELGIPCTNVETMKEAVPAAFRVAEKGDTVLLSPASASWDQYKKFEDRGDEFKELVNNLGK